MVNILQEYQLHQDFMRLNHQDYFHQHFIIPDIMDFFRSVSQQNEYKHHKTIRSYCQHLRKCSNRSVFIVLKWLASVHQVVGLSYHKVSQVIAQSLAKMEQPNLQYPYQHYFYSGIVKPYAHFIIRMININSQQKYLQSQTKTNQNNNNKTNTSTNTILQTKHLSTQDECLKSQQQVNKQNKETRLLPQTLLYAKYNLIKYAFKQLIPSLEEMKSFFRQKYPFLLTINHQIKNDVEVWMADLKKQIKYGLLDGICSGELQRYGRELNMLVFDGSEWEEEGQAWQLTEEISERMGNFMQSATKNEQNVLTIQQTDFIRQFIL